MALRSPLTVQPYDYIADSNGRPLDYGQVYIGVANQDPEFYQIPVYLDAAMTKPIDQPIRTNDGFVDFAGSLSELYASAEVYSVKVLDKQGRKVIYKAEMMRDNLTNDALQSLNTAIGESQQAAENTLNATVESIANNVPNIVNAAINNTAVEGGVLADTFVTATANGVDRVARTQRDVNSDRVSIKDFGSPTPDGDWTSVIQKAALSGVTVWFPDGDYKLRSDNFNCMGKDIIFKTDNARIILLAGSGTGALDVTDCNKVILDNFTFTLESTDNDIRRVFNLSPTSYIDLFQMTRLKFEGKVVLIRGNGSTTQLPSVTKYGFGTFAYTGCKANDMGASHVVLSDYPMYRAIIVGTRVNNFLATYFNIGINNGSANGHEIMKISSFFIDSNVVTNDDSWWGGDNFSGSYHCFVLAEGHEATWTNNHVSGLKSTGANIAVYDSYLSCKNVTSQNNHYKNNANFNANNLNNWMLKAKADSSVESPAVKTFINNTYRIEGEWLKRIGKPDGCTHKLYNIGVYNTGKVIMKGLVFDVHNLESSGVHKVGNLVIDNLTVKAKKLSGAKTIFELDAVDTDSILSITNFDLSVDGVDSSDASAIFLGGRYAIPFRSLKLDNIKLFAKDSISTKFRFLYGVRAENAEISNNTQYGAIISLLNSCRIRNLKGGNNRFVSTDSLSPLSIYGGFYGNTDFKATINSKLIDFFIPIYTSTDVNTAPKTANTNYIVNLDIVTSTGFKNVRFKYTLNYLDGVYSVIFIGDDDVENTAVLRSSALDNMAVKVDVVGDSSLSPTTRFRNRPDPSGYSYFEIRGLSGVYLSCDISISSFEV